MQIAEIFEQQAVKACYTFFSIMILCYSECIHIVTGQLSLSPMTVAPVCRVGDPLNLTCTSSIEFITWSISRVNEQGDLENVINDEPLNSEDTLQMPQPIEISLATFTFRRISAQGELPLVTTLSIDSVSIGLVVRCIDGRNQQGSKFMPASTTIQIIDTSQRIQLISELNILEPHYDAANVTVTVEWDQMVPGIVYSVEVSPLVPIGHFTETTRYQLTIPYNETFNFSVMASTPCRPNDTTFKFITLNYAKCDHPRDLLSAESNVSVSEIEGYNGFPVEGSTVRFSCPSGLDLIGCHSSKCTEIGEWEPDFSQLTCNSEQMPTDSKLHNVIIIGSFSAVAVTLILLCTTLVTTAALFYRKGMRSKKQCTECVQTDKQVTAKDLYADQGDQHQPEDLVYADVSVSSKHKKRKKRTLKPTQAHDFDVEYSAVEHNLTVHDHKHELQVTKGDSLEVCLDTLLLLLHEQVSPKWREFGEAVEIDDMVLDSIASTCSPENHFVELLDYWLKYYDGKPTWSDIAEALYDIDLQKVAQDIKHVYETGKLPESEMDIIYINVTSSLPQFKSSTKTPHEELHIPEVLMQDKAPCGPYNESS